jgi:thiamine biosynthesis protein ThiS
MKIKLNGEMLETDALTIHALVTARNQDPATLVVEHNYTLVRQAAWDHTRLQEGDTIELLSFVGGG